MEPVIKLSSAHYQLIEFHISPTFTRPVKRLLSKLKVFESEVVMELLAVDFGVCSWSE